MAAPRAAEASLRGWQEARGARRGELAGAGEATLDYGDPPGEVRALREGCGLVDLSWRDRMVLTGADRRRFLNAYVTCDVRELEEGQSAFGFFTSAQGRILADATLVAGADRLLVLLPPGRGPTIREHLMRFLLADRVELAGGEDWMPLALIGPRTASVVEACEVFPFLAPWCVVPWPELGAPSQLIWVGDEAAAATAARLVEAGARPVGASALEIVRVESGVPRFGVDYDEMHFPQETGRADAVSYTKGCYLGQEVVARIHYRGHVNRRLCGFVFDPYPENGDAVVSGEPLRLAGEVVGEVGSLVVSRRVGRPIGLAVLQVKAATPGTALETAAGMAARVAPLPFVD